MLESAKLLLQILFMVRVAFITEESIACSISAEQASTLVCTWVLRYSHLHLHLNSCSFSSSRCQSYQIKLSSLVKTSFQRELDSLSIWLRYQLRKRKAQVVTASQSTQRFAWGSLSLQILQALRSGMAFSLKYFSTIDFSVY